jgi:predicted acyltransferase
VAIPFSLARRKSAGGRTRPELLGQIWIRALSLMLLGWLMQIPSQVDPLPEGYNILKFLRWITYGFLAFGMIVILFPWRSRRLAWGFPLLVLALFVILYWSHSFANRHALAAGLPETFRFGTGLFTPHQLRFPGVLVRIGVCYGVAASLALFVGWRTILFAAILLMAGYSTLMLAMPYPGHVTGALEKADNLARHIDEAVFRGHNYRAYPDPEGLLSTLPAIASVLIGILVGKLLRSPRPAVERCAALLAWGVAVSCLGVLLSWWLMPINKQIWTPSFTVFTAGMAMLGLGTVFYIADVRGRRWWALPFTIYGMNAIAAFVLAGVIGRVASLIQWNRPTGSGKQTITLDAFCKEAVADAVHQFSDWVQTILPTMPPIDTASNLSLAWAITFVLFVLIVMSVLYVLRIFIKV